MNDITPNKWIPSPEVRGYIYRVLAAAGPLLAAYGLLSPSDFSLWLALAGTILGAGGNILASANTPKVKASDEHENLDDGFDTSEEVRG